MAQANSFLFLQPFRFRQISTAHIATIMSSELSPQKRGIIKAVSYFYIAVSSTFSWYTAVTLNQLSQYVFRIHSGTRVASVLGFLTVFTGSLEAYRTAKMFSTASSLIPGALEESGGDMQHTMKTLTTAMKAQITESKEEVIASALIGLGMYKFLFNERFSSMAPSLYGHPGAFASKSSSLPATVELTEAERQVLTKMGEKKGCHTCGVKTGLFTPDLQPKVEVSYYSLILA